MADSALIAGSTSTIDQRKSERTYTKYQFPADLGAHAMIINFVDYSYNNTLAGGTNAVTSSTIVLPLPAQLQDSFAITTKNTQLNTAGAIGLDIMNGTLNGQNPFDIERMIASAQNVNARDMAAFGGRVGADYISKNFGVGGLSAAADIATATALNPHVVLDFDGVALKSHTFNWQFAPKNRSESDAIRDIITEFRRKILPGYKGIQGGGTALTRALLTYPNLIRVSLVGVDQSYFYYFKPGMVNTFSVHYGDAGTPGVSLLAGGKPTTVSIELSFTEAAIHTREDYGGQSEELVSQPPVTSGPAGSPITP